MKKLLCLAFALVCLSACGGKEQTVSCVKDTPDANFEKKETIKMTAKGDLVTRQVQGKEITATSDEIYAILEPATKENSLEEKTKDMKGIKYSLEFNKDKRTIKESIDIDVTKISTKNYNTLSGSSLDNMKISLEKTQESFEGQGYSCSVK